MADLPSNIRADSNNVSEGELLKQLKDVLLRDERIAMEELRTKMDDPVQLDNIVGPIIEEHLELLKTNFPESYYKVKDNMIQARLKTFQGEILDTIYPAVG